jgi:hypothetical protein
MGVGGEDALYQALNLKASIASKKNSTNLICSPSLYYKSSRIIKLR